VCLEYLEANLPIEDVMQCSATKDEKVEDEDYCHLFQISEYSQLLHQMRKE
jgi:hypothetical protein